MASWLANWLVGMLVGWVVACLFGSFVCWSVSYSVQHSTLHCTVCEFLYHFRFPKSKGVAGYVATSGETLNITEAYNDQRFNR